MGMGRQHAKHGKASATMSCEEQLGRGRGCSNCQLGPVGKALH